MFYVHYDDQGNLLSVTNEVRSNEAFVTIDQTTFTDFVSGKENLLDFIVLEGIDNAEPTPQKLISKGQPQTSLSVNTKLVIPIAIAAVIAIVAVVGFSAMNQGGVTDPVVSSTPNNPLLINLDQSTYQKADIISISGDTNSHSKSVELSIENSNGVKIWSENITPKNNGVFSTLIIAGGGGWENGGTYTISVSQGELKNGAEFKFVA